MDDLDLVVINKMTKAQLIDLVKAEKERRASGSSLREEIRLDIAKEMAKQTEALRAVLDDLLDTRVRELEARMMTCIQTCESELVTLQRKNHELRVRGGTGPPVSFPVRSGTSF